MFADSRVKAEPAANCRNGGIKEEKGEKERGKRRIVKECKRRRDDRLSGGVSLEEDEEKVE